MHEILQEEWAELTTWEGEWLVRLLDWHRIVLWGNRGSPFAHRSPRPIMYRPEGELRFGWRHPLRGCVMRCHRWFGIEQIHPNTIAKLPKLCVISVSFYVSVTSGAKVVVASFLDIFAANFNSINRSWGISVIPGLSSNRKWSSCAPSHIVGSSYFVSFDYQWEIFRESRCLAFCWSERKHAK